MNVRPHVIIVGAGIGGLTASIGGKALRQVGCTVTVLEQSSRLSEIGAGIQLAPNSTRILRRLGLLSEVLKYANFPLGTIVRRYANDVEIGPRGYSGSIRRRFDAPMLVIHRADLLKVLVQATLEAGVHLHTNAQVVTIDPSFEAKVTLSNGDHVEGDILVGADGIKSRTRANIASYFGLPDKCTSTGDSAYRMVIPRGKILERCPQILKTLEIDHGLSTRWIGPNGHIMAYPIRGNAFYNVVMVHSHKAGANNEDEINLWTRKGELSELLTFYGGWSNTVQGLAACIDPEDLIQWPLNARPNLPAWTVNRVCLLGDACHPMLPYVAQGAAQAIEDAAALAVCLSRTSDVSHALTTYESVRKDRAEFIQGCAAAMRQVLHLVDGSEQEQRDATMRAPRTPGWKHPDLWADLGFQQLIWGYDIVAETEKRFIPAPKMTSMNVNTVAGQDMGIAV